MIATLAGWLPVVADWASISGLLVSGIGLSIAVFQASAARRSADRAKEAAEQARARIRRVDMIAELASASTAMDEIKRLARSSSWGTIPDLCGGIRKSLILSRAAGTGLTPKLMTDFTAAAAQIASLEHQVEEYLQDTTSQTPSSADINEILSGIQDSLTETIATNRTTSQE